MKINNFILYSCLLLILSSCEKDDPIIPNEEELITTLTYTLTPMSGGANVVLSFRDLDGDGGQAPVITSGTLQANTRYTGRVDLLNEQESPAESITAEIEEEQEEHQFFYISSLSSVIVEYADRDAQGNPVGLMTELSTGSPGSGNLTIILRHEPDKSAPNVADGKVDNAGGETDIEVNFQINVQ